MFRFTAEMTSTGAMSDPRWDSFEIISHVSQGGAGTASDILDKGGGELSVADYSVENGKRSK